jgi:hypothetical protein
MNHTLHSLLRQLYQRYQLPLPWHVAQDQQQMWCTLLPAVRYCWLAGVVTTVSLITIIVLHNDTRTLQQRIAQSKRDVVTATQHSEQHAALLQAIQPKLEALQQIHHDDNDDATQENTTPSAPASANQTTVIPHEGWRVYQRTMPVKRAFVTDEAAAQWLQHTLSTQPALQVQQCSLGLVAMPLHNKLHDNNAPSSATPNPLTATPAPMPIQLDCTFQHLTWRATP